MGIFKSYDIRGIYGNEINEEISYEIGKSFGSFIGGGKIIVGYDMRVHSKSIFEALSKGLISVGCDVVNIGLCSTPMTYFANGYLKANGSVMITASHNTGEWNGFKLCSGGVVPISRDSGLLEIEKIYNEKKWVTPDDDGRIEKLDVSQLYGDHIKKYSHLNGRKLKIVADFANAMGSKEIEGIRALFDIISMNEKLDGTFPVHEANPLITETLHDLCEEVIRVKADFGIGFDGDADRCGFVDSDGSIIPMDLITAVIAKDILIEESFPQTILYDLRSSRVVKETIESCGGVAVMCRVGHSFIKAQMRKSDAIFAGELSGHYYFRENYIAESQAMALLKFANLIVKTQKSSAELINPLRKYYASGEINSVVKNPSQIMQKLKDLFADGTIQELDGLSIDYSSWWFNIRMSNTEPLLRLNLEASSKEEMIEKRDLVLSYIKQLNITT